MTDDRMQRLEKGALKEEADTIGFMIADYCHAHHGTKEGLCEKCEALYEYARKRLACCPFGEEKPVCAKCRIHCYKPEMREETAKVMRFGGPRIMFKHPILGLKHIYKSMTVTPPEKPRNTRSAAVTPKDK